MPETNVISNWPVEIHRDQVREMSKPKSPLVSVIVPVYNGQETACRAVDSALEQTYLEREIIVVDDGSTDSSLELLRGYGRRIQLIPQKHRGVSITRNTGLKAARGEYIALLDLSLIHI